MFKELFKNKDDLTEQDLYEHIERLWVCNNELAMLIKNITDIMRKMAETQQANKEDFAHLAHQTLIIAEQQNRLIAHVLKNEDMIPEPIASTRFH